MQIIRIDRDHPNHDQNAENGADGNEENDANQPPNDGRSTGLYRAPCLPPSLFRGTWRRTVRRGRMNLVFVSSPLEIKTRPGLLSPSKMAQKRIEAKRNLFFYFPTMTKSPEKQELTHEQEEVPSLENRMRVTNN